MVKTYLNINGLNANLNSLSSQSFFNTNYTNLNSLNVSGITILNNFFSMNISLYVNNDITMNGSLQCNGTRIVCNYLTVSANTVLWQVVQQTLNDNAVFMVDYSNYRLGLVKQLLKLPKLMCSTGNSIILSFFSSQLNSNFTSGKAFQDLMMTNSGGTTIYITLNISSNAILNSNAIINNNNTVGGSLQVSDFTN